MSSTSCQASAAPPPPKKAPKTTDIPEKKEFQADCLCLRVVSLRAKATAICSLMTGSAFHVRESDTDARADAEAMSSSVGIMAALLLALCVPVLFDSVYGVQTNSYMVTDPAWIGITYFFFLTMATFLFAFSVVCAILTILVTRQLSSQSESRLLFKIARAEFIMPVQHVTFGLMSMVTAFAFWLYIVFFDKSAVVECGEPSSTSTSALLSLNVSSDAAHSREKCSWYPELFIAIACWFIPVSMMTLNSATNVR